MPPLSHPGLSYRDLFRYAKWFCLQTILIAAAMLILWQVGVISRFTIPWPLVAVAALLPVARRRAHYPLLLGLGSAILAAQYAPLFTAYVLILSLPLYLLLRRQVYQIGSHPARDRYLYLGTLGAGFLLIPLLTRTLAGSHPSWWLNWHGLFAASIVVLYLRALSLKKDSWLQRGYFEHLGYILFPPQRLAVLSASPRWFDSPRRAGTDTSSYASAWSALGLAALKAIAFLILSRLHSGSHLDAFGPLGSIWYIAVHYVTWTCWIMVHFDIAVAFARALGIHLPLVYRFPLASASLISWWHRFNRFVPRTAFQLFPSAVARHSALWAASVVFVSFCLIPLGILGSVFQASLSHFTLCWFIFISLVALGIGWEVAAGQQLDSPRKFSGWRRAPAWLLAQSFLALAHVFLLNHGHFPGDPHWNWDERLRLLASLTGF